MIPKPSKNLPVLLLFLAALVLLSSGCGGGSEDAGTSRAASGVSGSASRPTKVSFIQKGDAICGTAESKKNQSLQAAFKRVSNSRYPAGKEADSRSIETKLILTVALPPIANMVDELDELDPPEGEAAEIEAMVAAFREGVRSIEEDPVSAVEGKSDPFARADQLATSYGFKACSVI